MDICEKMNNNLVHFERMPQITHQLESKSLDTEVGCFALSFLCEIVTGNSSHSHGIMNNPSYEKSSSIINSIDKARSQQFLQEIDNQISPYRDEETSEKIVAVIKDFLDNDKINLKKNFYDVRGGH